MSDRSSDRPPVIGLAGGIGAGKTAVATALADLGCVVSDSDRDARAVMEDPEVVEALRTWWGPSVVGEGGDIDRRAVADRVFGDPSARARLEGLLHPRIHERRRARFAAAGEATALVIDAPLLFEAGLDAECDAVLFVDADREVRLSRVRRTRGWDEAELTRRESAQWPLDRKRSRADEIVVNDLDDDPGLADRVSLALRGILAAAAGTG